MKVRAIFLSMATSLSVHRSQVERRNVNQHDFTSINFLNFIANSFETIII